MREWIIELHRRDKVLASTGWFMVAMVVVLAGIAPFDARLVTGINPWIKPIKFTASFAAYVWTLAWFMGYLDKPRWALQAVRWGISSIISIEFLCVTVQAARGTTSHYNESTPFNMGVWVVMSVGIMLNAALDLLMWALFLRKHTDVPRGLLSGIRLGILVFVLGGLQGLAMVFGSSHTVGLPDGGPGLPFIDWSTRAGDLRIAHLLGLHALQILPLVGHLVDQFAWLRKPGRQISAVASFSALYVLVAAWQFALALQGVPLLRSSS